MKTPREKYMRDNYYKALVDVMCAHIHACNYTPSEMREAAVLACIIYEENRIQPMDIPIPKDIDNGWFARYSNFQPTYGVTRWLGLRKPVIRDRKTRMVVFPKPSCWIAAYRYLNLCRLHGPRPRPSVGRTCVVVPMVPASGLRRKTAGKQTSPRFWPRR